MSVTVLTTDIININILSTGVCHINILVCNAPPGVDALLGSV